MLNCFRVSISEEIESFIEKWINLFKKDVNLWDIMCEYKHAYTFILHFDSLVESVVCWEYLMNFLRNEKVWFSASLSTLKRSLCHCTDIVYNETWSLHNGVPFFFLYWCNHFVLMADTCLLVLFLVWTFSEKTHMHTRASISTVVHLFIFWLCTGTH